MAPFQYTDDGLDWYAVDVNGLVALLTNEGRGAVPDRVATSPVDPDAGVRQDLVHDYFDSIARTTTSRVDPLAATRWCELTGNKPREFDSVATTYLRYATGGCHVYVPMSEASPSPYFRVSVPDKPIHMSSVPGELQRILHRLDVDFQRDDILEVQCILDSDGAA